jgi:hypothetical protein
MTVRRTLGRREVDEWLFERAGRAEAVRRVFPGMNGYTPPPNDNRVFVGFDYIIAADDAEYQALRLVYPLSVPVVTWDVVLRRADEVVL